MYLSSIYLSISLSSMYLFIYLSTCLPSPSLALYLHYSVHSAINSFNKNLLTIYFMTGPMQHTEDIDGKTSLRDFGLGH